MKIGPKTVRFMDPVWPWFRRRLAFFPKGGTIHLQETALVVEGHRQRFFLPVIDRFIRHALCEWSMVTVPYGRIVRHRYCRYRLAKGLWWLVAGPLAALLLWLTVRGNIATRARPDTTTESLQHLQDVVQGAPTVGPALLLALLVISYLFHRALQPRHFLRFRRADGQPGLLCFRFTSRKQRQRFVELLEANRKTAGPPAGSTSVPSGVVS